MTCPFLRKVKIQLLHTRQSLIYMMRSLMHMKRSLPHLPERSMVNMSTYRITHMQPQQCQRVGVATREGNRTAWQELNVN